MKRLSLWVALALAVAGGVAWGVNRARGPRVETVRVRAREVVQTVVASGRVAPPARIALGLLVAGIVRAVHVEEGAHVREGDLLVELDDAEARALVDQARARLAGARALAGSVRRVRSPLAAQSSIQAQLGVARAQEEFNRRQRLAAAGAATIAELDDARRALDLARSQAQGAAVQSSAVAASGAESRSASAQVAEAEAALAAAEARLAQTRLVARTSGVVVARSVEPGDVAQPGRTLIELNRDGAAELVVTPDEQNLALLREGQPVVASADAFPDRRFAARVAQIAPAVDARRGTIEVHLAVPSPPDVLRPEMTVSVEVEVGRRARAIALPAALVREAGTPRPWVLVVAGDRTARRDVRLGLRGDDVVEIASGLAVGDLVVDAPTLAPGARVRPLPPRGAD
jgi:HlyD family secretion protein